MSTSAVQAILDTTNGWLREPRYIIGEYDCCQFVRRYYLRRTGRDIGGHLRYYNHRGLLHLLKQGGGLPGLLEREDLLGVAHYKDSKEAVLGDIVVAWLDHIQVAGVVNTMCVVALMEEGLMHIDKSAIIIGWHIDG